MKKIRLTESDIYSIVKRAVRRIIKETNGRSMVYDEWLSEEDYDGHTGEPGMIRSYDIGTYYDSNAEKDARENGYEDVAKYLEDWFDEIRPDCPWYWQKIGPGYGYHGTTIFERGGLVCKNIYGQIMFDEDIM